MKGWGCAVLAVPGLILALVFSLVLVGAGGASGDSGGGQYEVGVEPGPWGGFENGQIPLDRLAPVPWAPDQRLRTDAVDSLIALDAKFQADFGGHLWISDGYRDLAGQWAAREDWCAKGHCENAAIPGTSNHGWALAVDLGSGIDSFYTPQYAWMELNGPLFGWQRGTGAAAFEPWHWEFWGWAGSGRPDADTPAKVYAQQRVGVLWAGQADVDAEFGCLDQLWTGESNWNPHAENPDSGAYGIPQALPGDKMATAGADWRTNANTQVEWGLDYIKDRYGTPCQAWDFWQSKSPHWY